MADEHVAELLNGLSDNDWATRLSAVDALERLGRGAMNVLDALRDVARHDPDVTVRTRAVRALASVHMEDADVSTLVRDLVECLHDGEWQVRKAAADGLSRQHKSAEPAIDDLEFAVADSHAEVTRSAVHALLSAVDDPSVLINRSLRYLTEGKLERYIASARILATLRPRGRQREQALAALWESFGKSYDLSAITAIFDAIVSLADDADRVIDRLMEDPELEAWQKGYLLLSAGNKKLLRTDWQNNIDKYLPLILESVEYGPVESRAVPIDWLTEVRPGLPEDVWTQVSETLYRSFRESGLGFKLIGDIAGRDAALDGLFKDTEVRPEIVARGLLAQPDGIFEQAAISEEGNTEKAIGFLVVALQDPDESIRRLAAETVGRLHHVPEVLLQRVEQALQRLTHDPAQAVQVSAKEAYARLTRDVLGTNLGTLEGIIYDPLQGEDIRANSIREFAGLAVPLEGLRKLVDEWLKWIAAGNQALLVETVAECLRANPMAVLPLVDQMDQEFQPDPAVISDLIEREIRQRVKQEVGETDDLFEARLKQAAKHTLTIRVQRRIVKQLADMGDPRYYTETERSEPEGDYRAISEAVNRHAITSLTQRLPQEEDVETKEGLTRILANLGGREAVDALVRVTVGDERERAARQELLREYYLEPSKQRSDEASEILKGAVNSAKHTVRLVQGLNVALFLVGLGLIVVGIVVSVASETLGPRVAGAVAGLGGFAGVLTQMVKDPLDRIQGAMTKLVQTETAFTSFVWELNLNSTFIQSQYVNEGKLHDEDIANTLQRIEDSMSLAMNLVSVYTDTGVDSIVPRLTSIAPSLASPGSTITLRGRHLRRHDRRLSKKDGNPGAIAIDHNRIDLNDVSWNTDKIQFELPVDPSGADYPNGIAWISLIVDGVETNALRVDISR